MPGHWPAGWAAIVCCAVWSHPLWAQSPEPPVPPEVEAVSIPELEPVPESDPAGIAVPEPEPVLPPPPPPKKKAPPAFPGPKTLPPTGPYKALYFDNDYSFKKDPDHAHLLGEELKNMEFCLFNQLWSVSTGGELRHRYMNEDNRLRPGGPIQADNQLIRWRHFIDVKAGDRVRFYIEGIHADSWGEEAPIQPIDVNRWDLQNVFVDLMLWQDIDWGTHTLRYGRQELLLGRQRLVSPLDWANTRRNFEGFRYWAKLDDWRLDLFATHPVNSATGYQPVAVYDNRFDQANYGVDFGGAYLTYSGLENTTLESYWLYLHTRDDVATRPDGTRHTIGGRAAHLLPVGGTPGNPDRVWDFDAEGALQVGHDNDQYVLAGFFTSVIGHTWKTAPWTPRLSGLFYYGSGDRDPKDNRNNTFNVLFPLGHAYWGISDNLSGQNLYDWSLQVDVKPTSKLAITGAWHYFELASSGDKLYNVAGAPIGTPGHGLDVGQAFDLYGYYAFNPNFDIQIGQSWFWYGDFIQQVSPRGDARQFYVQTSLRY